MRTSCELGNIGLTKQLLAMGAVDKPGSDGMTALAFAMGNRNIELIGLLLRQNELRWLAQDLLDVCAEENYLVEFAASISDFYGGKLRPIEDIQVLPDQRSSTLLGVQSWVRFCQQEFGEFPG